MNENEIKTGIGSGGDFLNSLFAELKKNQAAKQTPPNDDDAVDDLKSDGQPQEKAHDKKDEISNDKLNGIVKEADVDQSTENEIVDNMAKSIDNIPQTQQTKETIDQEEKQRVLGVLLPFYQEQAHQTTDHQVLQELIKDKKNLLQTALYDNIYIAVFPDEKNNKNLLIELQDFYTYEVIAIGYTDEQGHIQSYSTNDFIERLNEEIDQVSDPKEKERLQDFANKFSKNEEALHEYVEKINEKRIATGKEILTLSEFSEWREKEVNTNDNGIYSVEGYSYIDIDKDGQTQSLSFTLGKTSDDSNVEFLNLLDQAKDRLMITDDELAQELKSQSIDTEEVQNLLKEIRKTSPVPDPAEAQPSEDPYALRGGKGEYDKLINSYKQLKTLEDQGATKLKLFSRNPKNQALFIRYQEVLAVILLNECYAVEAFAENHSFDQASKDCEENRNKDKMLSNLKIDFNSGDKLQADTEDYKEDWMKETIAVALMQRNFAKLKKDEKKVTFWDSKLDGFINILAEKKGKAAQDFDYKKLYFNFDEPKPAVATPPETPPPLFQPESEEELKNRKLQAITSLIEYRFDSLYDDLKTVNPNLSEIKLKTLHDLSLESVVLDFATVDLELNEGDELNQYIVNQITNYKEKKEKSN